MQSFLWIAYKIGFLCFVLVWYLASQGVTGIEWPNNDKFLWGAATSAYQTEGSVFVDGRAPSTWDIFAHFSGKVSHGDTGDKADNSYDKIDEDVKLMQSLGLNCYRFSLSWSRILPEGRGFVNQGAIQHYNYLIDKLIAASIEPIVTIFHWDLPIALEEAYGGWLSPRIHNDFSFYADRCFYFFGDRVKKWITINEPWTVAYIGYVTGAMAPGRCSSRPYCLAGNSSVEGYIAAHNMLLAHARVVRLYRERYQIMQQGLIGITLNLDWSEPFTDSVADIDAASRRNQFGFAWFGDPIVFGDYPQVMKDYVGNRLPQFSISEKQILQGSIDFIGLNHYTSKYVYSHPRNYSEYPVNGGGWFDDMLLRETKYSVNGTIIGPQGGSSWLQMVPWGFKKFLLWFRARYELPAKASIPILITENGVDVAGESEMPIESIIDDTFRITYLANYLDALNEAMNSGVNIKGYIVWSLVDNFEWSDGYSCKFGLVYVNMSSPTRNRIPKQSAHWYARHISNTNSWLDAER